MRVLIAEENLELGQLWANHLQRKGFGVICANSVADVLHNLQFNDFDVLIMNLDFPENSVLGVADLATYRNPDITIVVVTSGTFFSDGSVFDMIPNARGFFNNDVNPEDLAEIVKHYAA